MSSTHQELPHSPDAERSVLGAILLGNSVFAQVATALAADDFVNAEIVFQRIDAADVVVLLVLVAPDYAAPLILFAHHGPEFNLDRNIGQRWSGSDRQVEIRAAMLLGGLGEYVGLAGGGRVSDDLPGARRGAELGGQFAGGVLVEVPGETLIARGPRYYASLARAVSTQTNCDQQQNGTRL